MTPGAPRSREQPKKGDTQTFRVVGEWIVGVSSKILPGFIISTLAWGVGVQVWIAENGYENHRAQLVEDVISQLPPPHTRAEIAEIKVELEHATASIAALKVELAGFRGETQADLRSIQRSINRLLED